MSLLTQVLHNGGVVHYRKHSLLQLVAIRIPRLERFVNPVFIG
jgi:hypothetical protein